MGCFIVPAAEAVITTVATKIVKSKKKATVQVQLDPAALETAEKIPFSRKMKWLNNMLWGGSALLAFEHLWHGELSPVFPFLTAAGDPVSTAQMLREMATTGTAMAALVTAAWLGMVALTSAFERKAKKTAPQTSPAE